MLTEELLRNHVHDVETYDELDAMLTDISNICGTAKLRIDCLLRPTLIMMFFIRAEAEREYD